MKMAKMKKKKKTKTRFDFYKKVWYNKTIKGRKQNDNI